MTSPLDKLNGVEREQRWPNTRPRDAASIILLDRRGKTPRVLMGLRHPGHRFMPNVFVFPGGRLEPHDKLMPVCGVVDPDSERRLMQHVQRPSLGRVRGLASACIRELYEETGILLGIKDAGTPDVPCTEWQAFADHGVYPDLEALTFVMRAITPPRRPKRFDTRFFTADVSAVAGQVEGLVGENSELIEVRWLTFAETEGLELPPVTRVVLDEVKARIDQGFSARVPVPFYAMTRGRFVRTLLD